MKFKFRRITRPHFATRKKLGIRLLFWYQYQAKSGVITQLKYYLNQNFKIWQYILTFWEKIVIPRISIRYEPWYSSNFEPGWYSCFDWTQFLVSNIELRLDLGYRLLRFALRANLESVPQFAEIWWNCVKF